MRGTRHKAPVLVPLLLIIPLLLISCSVGRRVVPQSDIEPYDIGGDVHDTKVLIASRDSDFKVEVAQRLGESLKDRPVHVRFTGIDQLAGEDASEYSAIIVMTKCIGWGVDSTTESFLMDNLENQRLVVLFTSGDGNWKPAMEGIKFDAVTSASVLSNVDSVTAQILEKVNAILDTET